MTTFEELQVEKGTIVVCGNGPSIKNVPEVVWRKYPLFCVNVWPLHHNIKPNYWTAWDTWSLVDSMPHLNGIPKFLNGRIIEHYRNTPTLHEFEDEIIWWKCLERIPGLARSDVDGTIFETTLHAAVWLSHLLGYDTVLLVGFDCQRGVLHDNMHFYDDKEKPEEYCEPWDVEMGHLLRALEADNKELWNLSFPTHCRHVPHLNWSDFDVS